MSTTIRELDLRANGEKNFYRLAKLIYRGDEHYCVVSDRTLLCSILRDRFKDSQIILLAESEHGPVARLVARVSPTLKDADGIPYGLIGFFEALDEPQSVTLLLDYAVRYLKDAGVKTILGPMDGDTWHKYRFNVGPYDQPPFMMEPYNPAYYPTLWTDFGFTPLESFYSKRIDDGHAFLQQTAATHERALSRGYTFRRIDLHTFQEDLQIIHRLSRDIFLNNFLYTDIDLDEFIGLYNGAKSMIEADLVQFAISPEGEAVGFVFSFPNYFGAVQAMRGKQHLFAKLRFISNRNTNGIFNVKSIGVLSGHRQAGVGGALFHIGYMKALEKGFTSANHCLIKEGNISGRVDKELGQVFRKYLLYQFTP